MRYYHRTDSARDILAHGFRDTTGYYLTVQEWSGVFLSDVPLDCNEGTKGEDLLEVEINEAVIAEFEWEEEDKPYREWCVPAAILNERATVRLLAAGDAENATIAGMRERWGRVFGAERPL